MKDKLKLYEHEYNQIKLSFKHNHYYSISIDEVFIDYDDPNDKGELFHIDSPFNHSINFMDYIVPKLEKEINRPYIFKTIFMLEDSNHIVLTEPTIEEVQIIENSSIIAFLADRYINTVPYEEYKKVIFADDPNFNTDNIFTYYSCCRIDGEPDVSTPLYSREVIRIYSSLPAERVLNMD